MTACSSLLCGLGHLHINHVMYFLEIKYVVDQSTEAYYVQQGVTRERGDHTEFRAIPD